MTNAPARGRLRVAAPVEWLLLLVVAYLPFLLSAPGRVSSDSKQALYVDPGRFLADAAYLWDAGVGAGTVPHQHIGYLWPMGPWFWAFDQIGVPTWLAQRLWLGTLTLLAALGTRWLVRSLGLDRASALAAALVYALTPYQLAFTARTSVLLLPWVGLPWLVELTRRAVHRGGWRHPAAFALVTFTVAGVNTPTLVLVGLGPLAVLVVAAVRGRWRAAGAAALRIGALSLPACAWWLAAVRVQGAYGLDVLAVTENLRTIAERSTPDDVLRGLGNWFFYGHDRRGLSIDQAGYYDDNLSATVVASFLLPMLALAAAAVVRWRHRALSVGLVAAAVVAVGAWPYDNPSPVGRLFRAFAEGSSVGLAFRNAPRVVPVVVLGLALLVAAAVASLHGRAHLAAAAAVCLLAIGALYPVARVGMLSKGVERPADLPDYWNEAAAHLDAQGNATRVLELPGANFAAYRWGNTIEPLTPLLTDRPYLAREVLPYGSPESALLLDALDRRLQNGVLDPASLAPVARLFSVGDIVVRSDLEYERFGLPSPDTVWSTVVDPRAPGLGPPVTFGEPTVNAGDPRLDPLSPSDLSLGPGVDRSTPLPPVAVLPVIDSQDIVRLAPVADPVVLDGDGDGIVDAAAAAVIDGRSLVLESPALSDTQLDDALEQSAHLVVTDSHRRRIQTWFYSLRDTRGPTEQAGEVMVEPSGYDARLASFPDATDEQRTVVEQIGARVTATWSGGADRPADRPAAAVDGRLATSWRVGGADPDGNVLRIRLERPQRIDHVTLVQPQDGPRDRVVTRARLRFGDGTSIDAALGDASLAPDGQTIAFPPRTVDAVDVQILATSTPSIDPSTANAVGFAEVGIDDLVVAETVRMPLDLLTRAGDRSADLPLDLVMTRLRISPDDWQREDDEASLDRSFDLPTGRRFALRGTARLSDTAPDPVLDEILGTAGATEVSASSRLQGDPDARASRAVDGDPATAWTAAFGTGAGSWIDLRSPQPHAFERLELGVVADGRRSLPATVTIEVDGERVGRTTLDPIAEGTDKGHVTQVTVPLDRRVRGRHIRLLVDEITARTTPGGPPGEAPLPVAIAEIAIPGVSSTASPAAPVSGQLDTRCRDDLVTVDGRAVATRVIGRIVGRTTGPTGEGDLAIEGCEDLELEAGTHRLRSSLGDATGLDVDAVALSSRAGGAAGAASAPPDPPPVGADLVQASTDRTRVHADIDAEGSAFWFVLGQSSSSGWNMSVDGGSAGPRTLVDGYANGWLITPDASGRVTVTVTWTPQRQVWIAMGVTALALAISALILLRTARAGPPTPAPPPHLLGRREATPSGWRTAAASGILAGVGVALVSRWWIGLLAAAAAVLLARWPVAAWGVAVIAPLTLLLARVAERPELGWLALGWVVAAVVADLVRPQARASP